MLGLAKNCGLDFESYIMHSGKYMKVNLDAIDTADNTGKHIDIKLDGMVIYDKLKLIQDMIRELKLNTASAPRKRILNLTSI